MTHREIKAKPAAPPATNNDMANVTVVTGPPAAGKTTHVREHAQNGDINIDYDLIANTLSGKAADNHEHAAHIQTVTKAARRAGIADLDARRSNKNVGHVDPVPYGVVADTSPDEDALREVKEGDVD